MAAAEKVNVLNIKIDNVTFQESVKRFKFSKFIVTPNIDHLYNLKKNLYFHRVYQKADLILCDSKIISILSSYFFKSKLEQIAGSDYFPAVCKYYYSDPDVRIFLLGGTTPLHAENAFRNLKSKYNAPVVGYYSPPFGFEKDDKHMAELIEMIEKSGANYIAVGLGSPKQELLIDKLLQSSLSGCGFVAIGATIDFESGLTKRSPKLLSKIGLEWFYRFVNEPRRLFRRYFINGPTIILDLVFS